MDVLTAPAQTACNVSKFEEVEALVVRGKYLDLMQNAVLCKVLCYHGCFTRLIKAANSDELQILC